MLLLTHILLSITVFLLGIVIGSFIGVLVFRMPYGISIIKPNSRCDRCEAPLKFYDNIPLFSYILLKGKCRACGDKIDPILPIIEQASGLLLLTLYLKFGAGLEFIKAGIFLLILLLMSFTDIKTTIDDRFETGVILDRYLMVAIVYAIYLQFANNNIIIGLASFAIGFLILYITAVVYKMIRGRDGIGDGDMLLLGAITAYTTYNGLGFVIVVASLAGISYWFAYYIFKKKNIQYMPFAPFLSVGALAYVLAYM